MHTIGNYAKFLSKAVKVLSPQRGEKILDLCSGTGRVSFWILQEVGEEGEVIGMDLAQRMIDVARERYGKSDKLVLLRKDVTQAWEYEDYFDGIFMSFALHELPEKYRLEVLKQSYSALKERGRMVIADFNPYVCGIARTFSLSFFNLFEKGNLTFFDFDQNEALKRAGFTKIRNFPITTDILQITLAQKD